MKVFILTLLVLSSLCFVLGDEERKDEFIDLDTVDEGPVLKNDEQVEDYVEDAGQSDESEDELQDPEAFKDDEESADNNGSEVDPMVEPTRLPTVEPAGSGDGNDAMMSDDDLRSALEDKLRLK
ncbi:uncharacterized protein [Montipora capricornis]|uniref:uncharacterized protein n=1 Tax=Montipora capricornis TaxID=246305 RepID=UPI0035F1247D